MKEFRLRPYQQKFLDNYRADQTVQIIRRRGTSQYIGVDLADPGSLDKNMMTVVERKPLKKDTIIFMDEIGNWPTWYNNPILWWKLRKIAKSIKKQAKANPEKIKMFSTPKGNNDFYERFKN